MRAITILTSLLLLALMAVPASATRNRDYDNHHQNDLRDRLDYWTEYADDMGFDVLDSRIESISQDKSFYIGLGPGTYHAYAESNDRISDLDMYVYSERGRELDSDTYADNYPIVMFTLNDYEEVEIYVEVYDDSYNGRCGGEFVFVLARENYGPDGWRYDEHDQGWGDGHGRDRWRDRNDRGGYDWYDDDYHGYDDNNWDNNYNRDDMSSCLDDLREYAQDNRMDVIIEQIDTITDSRTYELTLDRGTYVVYAAGSWQIDDLDVHVMDYDGWTIAEDVETDAEPAVWFELNRRSTVEIEVEVWSFTDWNDEGRFALLVAQQSGDYWR